MAEYIDAVEVKLESFSEQSGFCRCCLGENNLKSMFNTYYYDGYPEVYSEILVSCFAVELTSNDNEESLLLICETCISRLRDAWGFKNQVKDCLQTMRESLNIEEEDNNSKVEKFRDYYESNSDSNFEDYNKKKKPNIVKVTVSRPKRDGSNKIVKKTINKRNKKRGKSSSQDIVPYKLEHDAVICPVCNETFLLHTALVRHMIIHYPNFSCHICDKKFLSEKKLRHHIYRHDDTKKICEICKKEYKGEDSYRSHMRQHYKPDVVYKCPMCNERFAFYYQRMKHMRDIHKVNIAKHKCSLCPLTFNLSGEVSRHMRQVHMQERKVTCSECGLGFFNRPALNKHMVKHTGIRNYTCDICEKSYARKSTLTEHMKIHTKEKRFVCPFCNRAFTQKGTLMSHLRTHRDIEILEVLDNVDEANDPDDPTEYEDEDALEMEMEFLDDEEEFA